MSTSTTEPGMGRATGSQPPWPIGLPEPDTAATAHSGELVAIISDEIHVAGGSIGFDRFMQLALYHPHYGYYRTGATKIGAGGDFVTAPSVSPLFSQCLARQCAALLAALSAKEILEFGAGNGVMAADLLATLEGLGELPQRYYILELSAHLRQSQRETLRARAPHLFARVHWLDSLAEVRLSGVVLANEVLDAMPVRCFKVGAKGMLERRVGVGPSGRLEWVDAPADAYLQTRLDQISRGLAHALPVGYCSEINVQHAAWIRSLAQQLQQAVVLIIDYGYPRREYYHPERQCGTLLCHYRHRAHDNPFFYPGLQDISANVDFSAIAEAADAAGLATLGYTSQAQFLLANGLDQLYAEARDTPQRLRYAQHIKRLTLPAEMGERFQVMALGKAYPHALRGFTQRDYRFRL